MNVEEVLRNHRKKKADKPRNRESKPDKKKEEINPKKLKLYFDFERMEPLKWPEPRDLRAQLSHRMIRKYKGEPISKIPLSTEFILKKFRNEPALKYKVINIEWDEGIETRKIKNVKFTEKMFRWLKDEENYGIFDEVF